LARSAASRPFWAGLAEGELRLPYCPACDAVFFYPRPACPRCWSEDITWRPAPLHGTVYAVTTVHVAFDPSLDVPYTVALVDLDAGVRLPGRVEAGDETTVAVGDRVQLCFASEPAEALPVFRPAAPD
jgi:uncharacterized OB-fold protein